MERQPRLEQEIKKTKSLWDIYYSLCRQDGLSEQQAISESNKYFKTIEEYENENE